MDAAPSPAPARPPAADPDRLDYRPAWDALTIAALGFGAVDIPHLATALTGYLARGGNLLDAQSQPAGLGAALALSPAAAGRPPLVICAQGGPASAEAASWLANGLIEPEALTAGYCFAPAWVRHQIRQNRAGLGRGRLDLFWLAGADALYTNAGAEVCQRQLREALAALEVAVAQREIAAYGLSLEHGALPPALALEVARDVAGDRHHLRALKLPLAAAGPAPAPLTLIATAPERPAALPEHLAAVIVPAA